MKQHPIHKEYSCDDFGNVYKNGKLLKGTVATTGYRQYRIDRKSILGHRLVTECRIGRKLETAEVVNHLNLDKLDNSVTNLEITDSRGNRIHYWNAKVIDTSNIDFSDVIDRNSTGQKNGGSKLSDDQAKDLILDLLGGMSNKEAAIKYGLHDRYVSLIRHKKRWKFAWVELGLERSTTRASCS